MWPSLSLEAQTRSGKTFKGQEKPFQWKEETLRRATVEGSAVDPTEKVDINLSNMSTFVTVGDGDSDDEAKGAATATTAAWPVNDEAQDPPTLPRERV